MLYFRIRHPNTLYWHADMQGGQQLQMHTNASRQVRAILLSFQVKGLVMLYANHCRSLHAIRIASPDNDPQYIPSFQLCQISHMHLKQLTSLRAISAARGIFHSAHNPRTTLALAKIEATQAKASAVFLLNFFISKFVVTPGIARARAGRELQRQDLHVYFSRWFHACFVASPEFSQAGQS